MASTLVCMPKSLPQNQLIAAARIATKINPVNHPPMERLIGFVSGYSPKPEHIAVMTTKYWHTNGVQLTVGFLDNPDKALRDRIIMHMNAWATRCNVSFKYSAAEPQVRIARNGGDQGGYWSYLGTDILSIVANQPTMNLEGFTMRTPEAEFHRVVRHETGHTLGCPHEHMRRELVNQIDRAKAIKYFKLTQGWSEEEVIAQVLTPIEDGSLLGTVNADPNSIMCYQIPGTITKNGRPILGGIDIDEQDYEFMSSIYPKAKAAARTAKPSRGIIKRSQSTGGKRTRKRLSARSRQSG